MTITQYSGQPNREADYLSRRATQRGEVAVRIIMASQDKPMPFIKNLASSGECLGNVLVVAIAVADLHRL